MGSKMADVIVQADTFEKAKEAIEAQIREQVGSALGAVLKDLRFEWSDIGEDEATLNVVVLIDKHTNPKVWRNSFFGLTSKVRRSIDDRMLRPKIYPELTPTAA